DGEGDDESPPFRIVLPDCGNDAYIDVAVLEIKPPQQFAIRLDPIRIVDVTGLQECQKSGCRGLDHVLEAVARIGTVADEIDGLDAGLAAFRDLEDEIDAVVRKVDDLGLDADVEAAAAAINLHETGNIRLHDRARQGAAFLGLNFSLELIVLDLLVALEG